MKDVWHDMKVGAAVGVAAGLLETPFAAGLGKVLGFGKLGNAAVGANTAILGVMGGIACTPNSSPCGTGEAATGYNGPANPPKGPGK